MYKYSFRKQNNPFALYEDTRMSTRIKKELKIIAIIFLLGAILLAIAVISDRARIARQNQVSHDNYQVEHLPVITPKI